MFNRDDAYKNFSEELRDTSVGQLWNISEHEFQPYVEIRSTNRMRIVDYFNYTDFKRHIDLSFRILENGRPLKVLAPVECSVNVSHIDATAEPSKVAAHLCPEYTDILLGKVPGSIRELAVVMKVCDNKINDFCEPDPAKIHLYIKKHYLMFLTNSLKVDYSKYYEKPTRSYVHYGSGLI